MSGATGTVTSRANPLVRRLLRLKQRADPAGGLALLEGPKLVEEALRSGVEIVEAAASPRADATPLGRRLLAELDRRRVPLRRLDERLIATVSEAEASQGLLAVARRPSFAESRLLASASPLLIVAVAVQNPGNLGGLLRTAEAAGADGAYLTAGCADPFSWKALRGSMGSAFRLPHVADVPLPRVLERLRAAGLRVAAGVPLATRSPRVVPYTDADLTAPVAFLLGNEGAGLPDDVAEGADLLLTIPMPPAVESLNVGVAAGVLLFEAARQRRAASGGSR